ncbi:MAG TPA: FkbM family methyltransferase [Gammaproteobacteria bacterium]|nr:FkbM family methyltransferase [Gammaproteobacteria bacterium]
MPTDKDFLKNLVGKMLQKIPSKIPGRQRFTRFLTKPIIDNRPALFEANGLYFCVPSLKEPIAFSLWSSGAYEPEVQELILSHWKENTWFIDVGANVGAISIPLSKLKPGSRVLGIEASPSIFPYLKENVSRNQCENMTIVQCAVCDEEGVMLDFNEAPESKFGMGSLGTSFGKPSIQVKGHTLDTILADFGTPDVSVMKVDVEGFESAVFLGAKELLKEQKPRIIFEFCDWAEENSGRFNIGESQKILREAGYEIYLSSSDGIIRLTDVIKGGYENLIAFPRN